MFESVSDLIACGVNSDFELSSGVDAAQMLERELHLLQHTDRSIELLLWESKPAIVISTQDARLPNANQASQHLLAEGWPVVVRKTGGTAFPQGPGIVNVSMILNEKSGEQANNIEADYEWFCGLCQMALSAIGVETDTGPVAGSFCDGRFNIRSEGRKLAGTSQRWTNKHGTTRKLFHCGLLFEVDTENLCDKINTFYSIASADHNTGQDPVHADRHTSVRQLKASANLNEFLVGLQDCIQDYAAK